MFRAYYLSNWIVLVLCVNTIVLFNRRSFLTDSYILFCYCLKNSELVKLCYILIFEIKGGKLEKFHSFEDGQDHLQIKHYKICAWNGNDKC